MKSLSQSGTRLETITDTARRHPGMLDNIIPKKQNIFPKIAAAPPWPARAGRWCQSSPIGQPQNTTVSSTTAALPCKTDSSRIRNLQVDISKQRSDQQLLGRKSTRKVIADSHLSGIKPLRIFDLSTDHDRELASAHQQKEKSSFMKYKDVTESIIVPCMSPVEALMQYEKILTLYEQDEIWSYPEIYFVGTKAKKLHGVIGGPNNCGYDNNHGYYQIMTLDHVAYRYEVLKTLGKGSFGQVVEAYDHKTHKNVALKIVRNKRGFQQQAEKEVKILEQLNKTKNESIMNIVHMIEHFEFRNHTCIAFELLGLSLNELMKKKHIHGFNQTQVKKFARSILKALEALQKYRIIHRDLKPDNILLNRSSKNYIKIIDFGASCFEYQSKNSHIPAVHYRAPEVILGEDYGMAIDMWAFGCIVAELLTGDPLLKGENEMDQLACMIELLGMPSHIKGASTKRAQYFGNNSLHESCQIKILHDGSISYKGGKTACGNLRGPPGSRDFKKALGKLYDPLLCDFLKKCLEFDPAFRLTPSKALLHPWLCEKNLLLLPTCKYTPKQLETKHTVTKTTLTSSATTTKVGSKLAQISSYNTNFQKNKQACKKNYMDFK